MRALLLAAGCCAVSVALEAIFAGEGIRKRLAEIKTPRFVPPLWGWIVIGAFYYVMFFAILYRLFSLGYTSALWIVALVLAALMMLINAGWNYFFFRSRNLYHAYLIGLPYTAIALALFLILFRLDRGSGLWLAPYLFYLCYANVWGYRVWKLNPIQSLSPRL